MNYPEPHMMLAGLFSAVCLMVGLLVLAYREPTITAVMLSGAAGIVWWGRTVFE